MKDTFEAVCFNCGLTHYMDGRLILHPAVCTNYLPVDERELAK